MVRLLVLPFLLMALPIHAEITPLDSLENQLHKSHRSTAAKTLKKAYDALQAETYDKAAALAEGARKDSKFLDYADWISGLAYRGKATAALSKRKKDITSLAQKSLNRLIEIEASSPYSPILKNLSRELALSEITLAEGYWVQKNWKKAEPAYEGAFQRLSSNGGLGFLKPEVLDHYSTGCQPGDDEDGNPYCDAWIEKLVAFYPQNSREIRIILTHFPDSIRRIHPSFGVGRANQAYKAPDLDQAAIDTAFSMIFDGKFGDAIKALKRFLDDYPKSTYRYRARYWLAESLKQDHQGDEAVKALIELQKDSPLTWYGLLASLELSKPFDQVIESAVPDADDESSALTAQEIIRLERGENFLAEGAHDLAAMELQDFKARDTLSSPFLMYLASLNAESENYRAAFGILGDLIQRGYQGSFTSAAARMIFPSWNYKIIQKFAEENELDPILILSLIKQESAFDRSAVSGSGAMGLMQLMPATACDTDGNIARVDLARVEENIRIGTIYFKKLLDRFNGNIVLALASYNAGPGAVERWFHDFPAKRGMLGFIESIPYKETREYVSGIIRNYFWYDRRIKGEAPKLDIFWAPLSGPVDTPSPTPMPIPSGS